MRPSLGKQNLQVKEVYWTVCEKRSRWEKKANSVYFRQKLVLRLWGEFFNLLNLTYCLRFPLVVSVLLRSFFSNAFFAITDVCTQVNREFKIPRRRRPRKRRLKSEFAFFQSLLQLVYFFKYKRTLIEPNS